MKNFISLTLIALTVFTLCSLVCIGQATLTCYSCGIHSDCGANDTLIGCATNDCVTVMEEDNSTVLFKGCNEGGANDSECNGYATYDVNKTGCTFTCDSKLCNGESIYEDDSNEEPSIEEATSEETATEITETRKSAKELFTCFYCYDEQSCKQKRRYPIPCRYTNSCVKVTNEEKDAVVYRDCNHGNATYGECNGYAAFEFNISGCTFTCDKPGCNSGNAKTVNFILLTLCAAYLLIQCFCIRFK